ncbi:hypothetical protein K9U39_10500 [Rhodoblastus acidophilus]|nr:hypothetical protein [Rhodoblastus acidophilus]
MLILVIFGQKPVDFHPLQPRSCMPSTGHKRIFAPAPSALRIGSRLAANADF